jgi:shikimate dehydrogenase
MIDFKLGLIGFPLGHSLSPHLHAAALRSTGLTGDYQLFPIQPFPEGQPALIELLRRLRQGDLHGLNVTIPHKQNVIPLLDELTPAAGAIGAVNTLYYRDGRLVGDNSDAAGFMTDLARFAPFTAGGQPMTALVLGAGGSARAVVYALAHAGWQVRIAARRLEQARQLVESLKEFIGGLVAVPLEPAALTQPFSLLVNTTPLGMSPASFARPWPAELPFPSQAFVYDLVYNPPETRLVQEARAAGLRATNGLGMLVEQAILAFETWTARRPARQALWDAVVPEQEQK